MKVIDLLNKIANGEIKDSTKFKIIPEDGQAFICKYASGYILVIDNENEISMRILGYEAEIIEDKEDINIQPIEMLNYEKYGFDNKDEFGVDLVFKINEIIKQQDELVQAVKHLEKTKEDK